ncbi:hypothetical protein HCEG_03242 [Histoplasma capsulatum var. duboisii H88]|uniref:Uncharacterized protein n=2 Tax=Ajellomyces capsulatus (strain H88) TaxID=544711 RepID=F0UCD4_AJEC8|nr:hypothetical protein HCEG_03242 [Histoplasma capsulatum var. duboisii H88]
MVGGTVVADDEKAISLSTICVIQFFSAAYVMAATDAIMNNILVNNIAPDVNPLEVIHISAAGLQDAFTGDMLRGVRQPFVDGLKGAWALIVVLFCISFLCVFITKWLLLIKIGPSWRVVGDDLEIYGETHICLTLSDKCVPCHSAMAVTKLPDDINKLVALASEFGCDIVGERRSPIDGLQVNFMPSGVVAEEADDRTAKILNAIATILVRRPRGGVFAVGARIIHSGDPQKGSVQLFLAGNNNIPNETKRYLEDVWQIMQEMALENRKKLARHSPMRRQNYFEVTPPKNSDADATGLSANYLELMRRVYIHGSKKFLQRLNKLYSALLEFMEIFLQHVMPKLPDDHDYYNLLDEVVYIKREIEWTNTQLKDSEGRDRSLELVSSEEFLTRMYKASSSIRRFSLSNFTHLDVLNEADERTRKPISRRFKKFVALQFALSQLERFTRSPRFYRILGKKSVEVICVNKSEITVTLPSKTADWSNVLKLALNTSGYEMKKKSETLISKIPQPKKKKSTHSVHCECNLLKYFVNVDFKPRPVSYIGVSKLSCAACAAVFAAWNDLHHNYQFKIRGSHGKWYSPWAAPMGWDNKSVIEEKLYSVIYQKISDWFTHALDQEGFVKRRLSDSSADSGEEHPDLEAESKKGLAKQELKMMIEAKAHELREKE